MKYDRNTVWTTFDGREIKIKDLTDVHLANVIYHLEMRDVGTKSPLLSPMRREAKRRKLTQAFLDRAPIPWQNVDGEWMRFNPLKGYVKIGR